ncbi:MAG: PAS domain S-box protein [Elusimicrobiota bacterium]|nr:PAS domain S-box protein [Elusimicrobiota bacterium]
MEKGKKMKKDDLTESFVNKLRRYSLDKIAECVLWINDKEECIYANAAACRTMGYSSEEICGLKINDIAPGSFSNNQWKRMFKGSGKQVPRPAEVKCVTKDGGVLDFEITIVLKEIENRKIACIFGRGVSEKVRAEAILARRIKLENIAAGMSSRFIKCASDEIDDEINHSLEKLGQGEEVDRAYIFLIHPDGRMMDNTHEWCARGVGAQKKNLQNCQLGDFPWWIRKLKRLETIRIDDVEKMPSAASAEKKILKDQNIKSAVAVPLVTGAYLHGFMGFDAVKEKKEWYDALITLLKITGEIIISALERKRVESLIQNKIDDLQKVADMAVKMELEIFSLKSKVKKLENK